MVDPIPHDYPRISPYLCVKGAADAIAFYCDVLGATERMRIADPDGVIGHAELALGTGLLMLSDEHPALGVVGPHTLGGSPVLIHAYVDDVDRVFARAVERGAKVLRPVEDQFYGDRSGMLEDPFGHRWSIATHVEDVSPEEMQARAAKLYGAGG